MLTCGAMTLLVIIVTQPLRGYLVGISLNFLYDLIFVSSYILVDKLVSNGTELEGATQRLDRTAHLQNNTGRIMNPGLSLIKQMVSGHLSGCLVLVTLKWIM